MANWIIDPPLEYTLVGDSSIKLTIPNDTPLGTSIKVTYKKDNTCSKSTTITVECITCEPERNTDFEGCINWFAHDCLNIEIEHDGDTVCTYEYLKRGWTYIREHVSTLDADVKEVAVGWFMANMFSELVPNPKTVTKFFRRATGTPVETGQSSYAPWGGIPPLTAITVAEYNKEVAIYKARIDSAAMFAQFRHETYTECKEIVRKSRTELFNAGVSGAGKNNTSFDILYDVRNNPSAYDIRDYVPEAYNKYIPKVPSQSSGTFPGVENYNTYDGSLMFALNQNGHYLNADDLKRSYDYGYLPLYDKRHTPCYARTIYGVDLENDYCNRKFDEFIGAKAHDTYQRVHGCEEVEYLASNFAKSMAGRWRPSKCTVGDATQSIQIKFICDDEVEQEYVEQVCSYEDASVCDGQQDYVSGNTSYPSGHASWGYTAALLSILYDGNEQCEINTKEGVYMTRAERGVLYGNHRYVVKAHWPTDVLIGQVIASSCIGYLMGFNDFDTLFNEIYPTCNLQPTPTECYENCECSHSRFGGGGDAWNRDSSGSGNGFAPKTGFTGSIKIGQWKPNGWTADNPGECYPSQCPEFDVLPVLLYKDPNGNNRTISSDEAQENVEYVERVLSVVQLSLNEDENASDTANPDDASTRKPYGHPEWWNPYFIVMSNLPENNTGHDVYVHIVAKCGKYDSEGKQSKFNFSQLG